MNTDSEDDVLFFTSSNIPENPNSDPLSINNTQKEDGNSNLHQTSNIPNRPPNQIINLDSSSDEEMFIENNLVIEAPSIFRAPIISQKIISHNHLEDPIKADAGIIDIDADDTDPLAPIRSAISSSKANLLNPEASHTGFSGGFSIQELSKVKNNIVENVKYSQKNISQIVKTCTKSKLAATKRPIDTVTMESSSKSFKNMKIEPYQPAKPKRKYTKKNMRVRAPESTNVGENIKITEQIVHPPKRNSVGELLSVTALSGNQSSTKSLKEHNPINEGNSENMQEDFEADIPVQKFVLYKPDLNNVTSSKIEHEQLEDRPRFISHESTAHSSNKSPPVLVPFSVKNLNPPGFDLNVNISNVSTNVSPVISTLQSQTELVSQHLTNPQYNVALVLNVNEVNTSRSGNQIGLNKVALDVSVNMNNKHEEEVVKNPNLQPSPSQLTPIETDQQRNSVYYCCSLCSYRIKSSLAMKYHVCGKNAQYTPHEIYKEIQVYPRIYLYIKHSPSYSESKKYRKDLYYCSKCFYKSENLKTLLGKECASSSPNELFQTLSSIKYRTYYKCALCSYRCTQVEGIKLHFSTAHGNHEKIPPETKSTPQTTLTIPESDKDFESNTSMLQQCGQIYFCSICPYLSDDYESFKAHSCSKNMNNDIHKSKQKKQRQLTKSENTSEPILVKELPLELPEQMYSCNVCSYQSVDYKAHTVHKCINDNPKNVPTSAPTLQKKIKQNYYQLASRQGSSVRTILRKLSTSETTDLNGGVRSSGIQNNKRKFCCILCSYKHSDMRAIQSHICPFVKKKVINHMESQMPSPNIHEDAKEREESTPLYLCGKCQYETTDITSLNGHPCLSSKSNNSSLNSRNTNGQGDKKSEETHLPNMESQIYCCAECPFNTSDLKTMRRHTKLGVHEKLSLLQHPNKLQANLVQISGQMHGVELGTSNSSGGTTNVPCNKNQSQSIEQLVEQYSCMKCFFETSQFEIIKKHLCVPQVTDKDEKGKNHIFHCNYCSYNGKLNGQKGDMNIHKCLVANMPKIKKHSRKDSKQQSVSGTNTRKLCISYSCDKCEFKSLLPELIDTHACSKNKNLPKNSGKPSAKFSCLACSFTTSDVIIANSHKCRQFPLLSRKNSETPGYCEICGGQFLDNSNLFDHVMQAHFSIEKVWTCILCSWEVYFCSITELSVHYQTIHRDEPVSDARIMPMYKCTFCHTLMEDTIVEEHSASHIRNHGNMIQTIMFHAKFGDYFSQIQQQDPLPPPVRPMKTYSDARRNPLDGERKNCESCRKNIFIHGIKCVNSDCENMYHITCCDVFSRNLREDDISNVSDWFCRQCNKKADQNLSTVDDTVENIDFCLKLTDRLLSKEMEIQNNMLQEMQQIKNENLAAKKEFERIKKFIMNSKSEKINSPMVRGVCSIIENFINAGVNDT